MRSPRRHFNAGWEVLADEMANYFGENCYWLVYKKEDWKIRNAFKICQEKRIVKDEKSLSFKTSSSKSRNGVFSKHAY